MPQTFGKVHYKGSLMTKDKNGRQIPQVVTYNIADLSNGEVDTGNHYKFDVNNKTQYILHRDDATYLIQNAKALKIEVIGVKLQKKEISDEELVSDDEQK